MANFSQNENFFELIQVSCTASLHGKFYMYSLAAFNVFLSITATLGNILILVALRKESSLHPQSKLLFRCLTLTDLFVGVLSQPLFAVHFIFIAHQRPQFCYTAMSIEDIAGRSLSAVSLFTVTVISVDRLLALLLGLRIQTKGDFKANERSFNFYLDSKHCTFQFTPFVADYNLKGNFCVDLHFVSNLSFLLHEDLSDSSPSSS